ncbi:hypothetical protein H8N01_23860 [Streptomyces sp. AC536]|uniref:hypothetical protein n=1 Tax=Streptomyces buecherae TaxID=2763006 RepID=UPI00164D0F1F|nr:hypothetical protein [Streptomyces buecherae]MBC3985529.1 hypothetical protein [Streptomyces buecherae]QNJ44815.1 hypothetical protein H7H31_20520 [Streptomyces buecherae]
MRESSETGASRASGRPQCAGRPGASGGAGTTGAKGHDIPNISSLGKDSPSGESSQKPSNSKGDSLAEKDFERLRNTLASLQEAAKKVNKSVARRAVEAQPDVAVPLIQEIGSLLQQIDRAVAIRLPKAE